MFTLAGSLLGFVGGFAPKLLEYLQDRQDKKHELAMVQAMRQNQREAQEARLELAEVEADAAAEVARLRHDAAIVQTGGKYLAWLSGSVRPVTTYWFLALFVVTKASVLFVFALEAWLLYKTAAATGLIVTEAIMVGGRHLAASLPTIWDEPSTAMFATILSFWFGDRSRKKAFGR